nr:uncharacterized protein LOC125423256 [Ziziphus jujuba var. spinosa]
MVFEIVIHCFGQQFKSFEVDEDRFSFVCLYDNVKFITCNESDEVEISDEDDNEWQGKDSNNEDGQFGSDEEDESTVAKLSRLMKRNLYKPLPDGKHHLQIGQTFECAAEFRKVLIEYSIQEGFNIYRVKNEKNRVTCECAATGCGWSVHASLMADNITFQIKTLREDHSCTMLSKNPMVTCEWLSRKIEDKVRCNPGMKIKGLKKEVREMIGVHVSNAKLYRAKNRVLERLSGGHGASYSKLHDYGNILLCKNPDTMVQVKCHIKCHRNYISENPVFQRYFLSFPAQKDGFLKGYRPFIGIDGCHLKGQFGGVLLTAVGVDANNSIFPLAFSVCEGENYDSWIWFLNLISEYIGVHETRRISFMSDRQKGLLKAINEVFPNAFN